MRIFLAFLILCFHSEVSDEPIISVGCAVFFMLWKLCDLVEQTNKETK
jgi:hypothetical protein